MRKLPLIEVIWEDPSTNAIWQQEDLARKETAITVYSVGWKLASNKRYLILVAARNEVGNCGTRQIIPRGCIKSIRRIE